MLVDWQVPLRDMIRTRNGRSLLRSYANDARNIVECILNSTTDYDSLRFSLRVVWNRRAELFYDARENEYPYIPHRYTPDYTAPHTFGDTWAQAFILEVLRNLRIIIPIHKYQDRTLIVF